jgi:hypothetical protein
MAVCSEYLQVSPRHLFHSNDTGNGEGKGKVIPLHAIKEYGGVNVQLHCFLTSHLLMVNG